MDKLKIEHLKGYLGTGLKCLAIEQNGEDNKPLIFDLTGVSNEWAYIENSMYDTDTLIEDVIPILKPMEMFIAHSKDIFKNLDIKEIKYLKDNLLESPVIKLSELNDFAGDFYTINYLYQNHYDIHGLINNGLAVDWREYNE